MRLFERELTQTATDGRIGPLEDIGRMVARQVRDDQTPIRFAVTESSRNSFRYEVGILEGAGTAGTSMFDLRPRGDEDASAFNAVLVVPTGIGAEIGGHAGDATPVARLLASVCDTLITHPNVVNASDLNEMPANGLYVEGSLLSRFLDGRHRPSPGQIEPRPRNHRLAPERTVRESDGERRQRREGDLRTNCPRLVVLDPPLPVRGEYTPSGRAAGTVEELERVFEVLDTYRGEYDAVAISTLVDVDVPHESYFSSRGEIVNPWGGVEAMLTHAISTVYNVPSAHAPMMESTEVANIDPGVVDPRMAAEVVSLTFLQSVLKGLHVAPRVAVGAPDMSRPDTLTARDVSCLVIPDGCVGLPTLAALEQGMPVIAVRENRSLMRNDLSLLPWAADKLHIVENYWEAVGLMAALKEGMSPGSVRRPLGDVRIERFPVTERARADIPTPHQGQAE